MTDEIYDSITEHLFKGSEDWDYKKDSYFFDIGWNDLMPLIVNKTILKDSKSVYYAPTAMEILNFLSSHISRFTCHGRVHIEDGVPQVILEGLCCRDFIEKDKEDFLRFTITSSIVRSIETPPILYNRW